MTRTIETDYLVIGAGAMGMAFTDTLISETQDSVVIVDRYGQPGGHWTMSYPFVRLHQPSIFYGVNSRPLGSGAIDRVGWNAGLYELASGSEVCAYFDGVMQQQFLPSGRVAYYPMCDYEGDGRLQSLVSGETFDVRVRKRTVRQHLHASNSPLDAPSAVRSCAGRPLRAAQRSAEAQGSLRPIHGRWRGEDRHGCVLVAALARRRSGQPDLGHAA